MGGGAVSLGFCSVSLAQSLCFAIFGKSRVSISHGRSVTCVNWPGLWTGGLESGLLSGLWT